MKRLGKFIITASVLLVAACGAQTNTEVEALNKTQATGTPFTKYLAAEYRAYSNHQQYEQRDYPDGIHFARKGLAAASGEVVMPEPLEDWNLDEPHYVEMGEARDMLVTVLENGARELVADKAAAAQARFDCWVETQEENWDADVIECKNQFYALLNDIQSMVKPEPAPVADDLPEPIEDVSSNEPVKLEEALFIVFFDWDESTLTSGAKEVLDAVASEISKRGDVTNIVTTGHTDSSGPEDYNEKLSTRRAASVKDALVDLGVDPEKIRTEARGEEELLVETADNVREPANRRVEISLE
ncbi:MAG: OmpA family protein [Pseudomonadota bacterium]